MIYVNLCNKSMRDTAFDSVDHRILLRKLELQGVSKKMLTVGKRSPIQKAFNAFNKIF